MAIRIGDRVPEGTLFEYVEVEGDGCSIGPNAFPVRTWSAPQDRGVRPARRVHATCSAKHVPGYVQEAEALRAKGVDEIWFGRQRRVRDGRLVRASRAPRQGAHDGDGSAA
jgi:peroxiredoxin